MSKEELMKYANDPFWVRLRWLFFVLFWGLWIAMLVGAILIIIGAPKCAAPQPLAWYKQGPLIVAEPSTPDSVTPELVENYQAIGTKGVIYELNWNQTYRIDEPDVRSQIEKLVEHYRNTSIKVILDITPNMVYKTDTLFVNALTEKAYRAAFIWAEQPKEPTDTWKSKVQQTRTSAWDQVKPGNYVLSQFGADTYDLQMNNALVKEKFMGTLKTLVSLGIKGFRLRNAKHFIVNTEFKEEQTTIVATDDTADANTEYSVYTHAQTTYQPGLGELLTEFETIVKNVTNGDGFLSVNEKIVRPETFTSNGSLGIELPIYGLFPHTLATSSPNKTLQLHLELTNAVNELGNTTWIQWEYDWRALASSNVGLSEYNMFMFLLPGVPVAPAQAFAVRNVTYPYVKTLEELRMSASYMHGSFESYTDVNYTVIAYKR